jgi:hypothetical protein
MTVLLGNGDGTFGGQINYAAGAVSNNVDFMVTADFNGDGALDLALSNFGEGTVSVFLNSPVAAFAPSRLTFGAQMVGTSSSEQAVTLTNSGAAPLTISSIAASGDFSAINNCGSILKPGANCQASVTFTPTAGGTRTGLLVFNDSVPGSPQAVSLSGTGTAPVVSLSAASLSFGNRSLSTTSAAQTETVTNTGTGNLTISTVTIGGTNASNFAKSADTCTGATVTPSSTCTVSVTFTPSAAGSRSASLNFTDNNNAVPGSTQTVTLRGTGFEPVVHWPGPIVLPPRPPSHPVPLQPIRGVPPSPPVTEPISVPAVSLAPSSLTFSAQIVGTRSSAQTVTLANTGNSTLTLAGISTSANFGRTNNCGGSVAANGSCTINVTFSPTLTGSLVGALTITDNNNGVAGRTQTVTLSGTGVEPVVHGPGPIVVPPSPPSHPVPLQPPL